MKIQRLPGNIFFLGIPIGTPTPCCGATEPSLRLVATLDHPLLQRTHGTLCALISVLSVD